MRPSLSINRGPMAPLNYYYDCQLILFNAAHQITTLLPVISNIFAENRSHQKLCIEAAACCIERFG